MAVNEFKYLNKVYDRIRSAKATLYESLSLSTLSVDTLTVTVVSEEAPEFVRPPIEPPRYVSGEMLASGGLPLVSRDLPLAYFSKPSGVSPAEPEEDIYNFENYVYGTECFYYHNSKLFGKFYVTKVEQVDRLDWKFSCVSAIGLLTNTYHYGGVYTGQAAVDVIKDIIGNTFPISFDTSMNRVKLYGWLPKDTKRNNLKKVLFASNAQIFKDSNGDLVFKAFTENDTTAPKTIDYSKYYLTGNRVTKGSPATQAQVTEHSYFASDGDVTVKAFSGEAKGDTFVSPNGVTRTGCLVDFKQPLHNLVASGCTILESGVNYAIITESANAVLTGQAYTHTERTMFQTKPGATSKPNVVSCTDCHLVSVINSELVAKRLMAYYGEAKKVVCDMVATEGERPGDKVIFKDPWSGEQSNGYIQKMEITFSKEIKAKTTLISGYYPPVQEEEQDFTHRVVLTGSGTWTVPTSIPGTTAKVKKVRYALFSGAFGGQGGTGGQSGSDGSGSISWTDTSWITGKVTGYGHRKFFSGTGGTGGGGGSGGRGSRILQGTLDVTPGQSISYSCGSGGAGGSGGSGGSSSSAKKAGSAGSTGSEGGATKFGSLSSANGTLPPTSGWVDVITQEIYCTQGPSGKPGGTGAGRDMSWDLGTKPWRMYDFHFIKATAAYDQNGKAWAGGKTRSGSTVGGSEVDIGSNGLQDINWSATETTAGGASYGLGPGGVAGVTQGVMNSKGSQSTGGATAISGRTPPAPVTAPSMSTPTRGGYGGYGGGGASAPGVAGKDTDANGNASSGVNAGGIGAGGPGGKGGTGGPGLIILYY